MARGTVPFSAQRPSVEYLTHLGPHQVAHGELDAIGIPGLVFAPHTGPRCPAVVLGHGYLQPPRRYADTMRYLASWGFVVAAPATEGGVLPSYAGLALDMGRVLERLADTKLHRGRVTVDRDRLAVMGHGIGGGAAVLAAASGGGKAGGANPGHPTLRAAMTIFASPTSPSAVEAASHVGIPGLHITGGSDRLAAIGDDGAAIARAWAGPVQLRTLKKADHMDLPEGKHLTSTLMGTKGTAKVRRSVRTLATAFLLWRVAGHDQLADEMEGKIAGTVPTELATQPS